MRLVLAEVMTRSEAKRTVGAFSVETSPEKRIELVKSWSTVDSIVRILLLSALSDSEVIVPDVETVVVLSDEGPEALGDRWQRMARMSGQRGCYMQFVPEADEDEDHAHNWADYSGCQRTFALEALTFDMQTGGDKTC